MASQQASVATFPFGAILCLIFITLKLTGVIAWSWVWVLAPMWVPLVIVLALAAMLVPVFARRR